MPEFQEPEILMHLIALPTALFVYGMVLLMVELFVPNRRTIGILALVGVLITAGAGALLWDVNALGFERMVVQDRFGLYISWIVLAATALTIVISLDYVERYDLRAEFYPLLLFSSGGMILLAQATDLIIIFLSMSLLSLALYVLTGLGYPRQSAGEAGMKYLLLGAFAAGFLVYGIALVYGVTGKTQLEDIAGSMVAGPLALVGMALLIIALGFKLSAVPFHTWTPDVYEGAPTPVTAYMSVATKAAAFAALFRLLVVAFAPLAEQWQNILAGLAALTMIVGNVVAVSQTSLKRMLAYSSVAHAGYMLLAVIAGFDGARALILYLVAYTLTNIGAFAVATALELRGEADPKLSDLNGLAARHPLLAAAMLLFMLSLAGVPPTVGFFAKFAVFQAAWSTGWGWLTIVGVITSAISAFFYLRIVVLMYMGDAEDRQRPSVPALLGVGLAVAAILVLALGLAPDPLLDAAGNTMATSR